MAPIAERMERVGELIVGGRRPEARAEAKEASRLLEVLARKLDALHRGIVSPEIATLVEFDRRVAELMKQLGTLKTDAEITAWHRQAAALVRDLERAGLADRAAELAEAMEAARLAGRAAAGTGASAPTAIGSCPAATRPPSGASPSRSRTGSRT